MRSILQVAARLQSSMFSVYSRTKSAIASIPSCIDIWGRMRTQMNQGLVKDAEYVRTKEGLVVRFQKGVVEGQLV